LILIIAVTGNDIYRFFIKWLFGGKYASIYFIYTNS
jgi:hypothetical protein